MEFKISSELKNIIGQDLIVNDQVAIFELVKNSYDAHATRVDIIFQQDKIIIRDNGKGMSLDDLKNKWLFVAYSAKKDNKEDEALKSDDRYRDYRNKINLKRGFAGAKGIGRFSADKIGENLKLIAKSVGTNNANQLDIDWKDFEKNPQDQFININVKHTELSPSEYGDIDNGVILEISNLKSKWDDDKIETLKKSLSKLINPFEVNTETNNFQIYITKKDNSIGKPVSNDLVDILTLKTTKLEITITDKLISSQLTDRGTLIYNIEERNNYQHLKNTTIILLYLNTKAKINFTRLMNVKAVNFGNIMLYNNGFRVYPYGEPNDDSLDIDRRHQQGHSRYLSTRNLIGSINVSEYSDKFKEKTSRDSGLIETDGYKELYNIFWEKALKRLEKYVVGVQWSLDEVIRGKDGDSDNFAVLDNINSQTKIIEIITSLIGRDKVEIKDFDANFVNLFDNQHPSETIISKLSKIAHDTSNQELIDRINEAQKIVKKLENEKIQLTDELIREVKVSEKLQNTIKQKEQQVLFFKSERTLNEDDLVNLQHHIGINAELVSGSITRFKRSLDENKDSSIPKSKALDILDEISIANQKIIAINNYATKADFITKSETINKDIVSFIQQYILNIHPFISSSKIKISVDETTNEFIMEFKPMEITIILDNIINNARKAKSSNLNILFQVSLNSIEIIFKDNGKGLDVNIENIDDTFQKGFTTTKGSGLGLHHIKQIIDLMQGSISLSANTKKGVSVILEFKK